MRDSGPPGAALPTPHSNILHHLTIATTSRLPPPRRRPGPKWKGRSNDAHRSVGDVSQLGPGLRRGGAVEQGLDKSPTRFRSSPARGRWLALARRRGRKGITSVACPPPPSPLATPPPGGGGSSGYPRSPTPNRSNICHLPRVNNFSFPLRPLALHEPRRSPRVANIPLAQPARERDEPSPRPPPHPLASLRALAQSLGVAFGGGPNRW